MLLRSLQSFRTTRTSLLILNVIYLLIALLLIVCGFYARRASLIPSPSIYVGVVVVASFLAAVAFLGIHGTRTHSQPILFFYMVILCFVFVVQFSVAVACLSSENSEYVDEAVSTGWHSTPNETLWFVQKRFGCCGLTTQIEGVGNCHRLPCWSDRGCPPCMEVLRDLTRDNLERVGALGLVFAFTELLGVWLARRFRNIKDPRLNPYMLFT